MVNNFIRKKLQQRRFPVVFFEILEKTYFVEHIRVSAVAYMWAQSSSKRDSITDAFLWTFYRKSFLQKTAVRLLLISCNIFNLSLFLSAINQIIHS